MSKPAPRTLPTGHVSVNDTEYANYFSIDPKTKRLFWDNKEIVARQVIDLSGIKKWWGIALAIAGALVALGSGLSGFVDLNKEVCWVKIGSCVVEHPSLDKSPSSQQ